MADLLNYPIPAAQLLDRVPGFNRGSENQGWHGGQKTWTVTTRIKTRI